MTRPHYQRGMTGFQLLLLLTVVLFVVYSGVRIGGIYLEYFNVHGAMNAVRDDVRDEPLSPRELRNALDRQFQVNNVRNVGREHVDISLDGDAYILRVRYDARTEWIGNIDLVVRFDRQVRVERR